MEIGKRVLVINITDEDSAFTEQLEYILSQINDGYLEGQGWSINELEEKD